MRPCPLAAQAEACDRVLAQLGGHVWQLVDPVAVLGVLLDLRRLERLGALDDRRLCLQRLQREQPRARPSSIPAMTTIRRPPGRDPSRITSSTPSAAPIQNERRNESASDSTSSGEPASSQIGGRARSSSAASTPTMASSTSQLAVGS